MSMQLLTLTVLALCVANAAGQMSMGPEEEEMMEAMGIKGQPMGRKNQKPQAELLKADFKYIRCGVCRKMVDVAFWKSTELLEKRFQFRKKRKNEATEFDGEGAVQEYVEKMCNPLKPEGEWVGMIDLVQEGDQLQLAQQPSHGKCLKECRTIEAVCEDVLDKADVEFTEILYKAVKDGNSVEQTQRYICNRAAGVCKKKPPKLVGERKYDERFQPMTADEKQMQDMQVRVCVCVCVTTSSAAALSSWQLPSRPPPAPQPREQPPPPCVPPRQPPHLSRALPWLPRCRGSLAPWLSRSLLLLLPSGTHALSRPLTPPWLPCVLLRSGQPQGIWDERYDVQA